MSPALRAVLAPAFALTGLLACAGPAPTPSNDPLELRRDGERVVLSIDEQGLPIADLVKVAQRVTGKTFTYSKAELTEGDPRVRVTGTMRVDRDRFYQLFQSLLYVEGFACVLREADGVEVVEIVRVG